MSSLKRNTYWGSYDEHVWDVSVNREQLADAIARFEFLGLNSNKAMRIALNRAAGRIKTLANRSIRTQLRLSASYVNGKLSIEKATSASLTASIYTQSRGLLLSRYSTDSRVVEATGGPAPKVGPRGVKVKVKPDRSTKTFFGDKETVGSPFYMVLRVSKAVGIVDRYVKQTGRKRNKVKVFHGPSVSQAFDNVKDDLIPEANAELTRQMADAMRYLLSMRLPSEGGVA